MVCPCRLIETPARPALSLLLSWSTRGPRRTTAGPPTAPGSGASESSRFR